MEPDNYRNTRRRQQALSIKLIITSSHLATMHIVMQMTDK